MHFTTVSLEFLVLPFAVFVERVHRGRIASIGVGFLMWALYLEFEPKK